jgi:hypothetical protein
MTSALRRKGQIAVRNALISADSAKYEAITRLAILAHAIFEWNMSVRSRLSKHHHAMHNRFSLHVGDHPTLIPIEFDVPSITSVMSSTVLIMESANDFDYRFPDVLLVAKLADSRIKSVAARPDGISVVTTELLTARSLIAEDRDRHLSFSSASLLNISEFLSVSCGAEHTIVCGVQPNGDQLLLGLGSNGAGQLGFDRRLSFCGGLRRLDFPPRIRFAQICCGSFSSFVLTDTSDVWVFGSNEHGQLGIDSPSPAIAKPTYCHLLNGIPINELAAGSSHSLAMSSVGMTSRCSSWP